MLKIPFCPEGQKGLPKYEMFFSNLAEAVQHTYYHSSFMQVFAQDDYQPP